jgi:hypothetical protein
VERTLAEESGSVEQTRKQIQPRQSRGDKVQRESVWRHRYYRIEMEGVRLTKKKGKSKIKERQRGGERRQIHEKKRRTRIQSLTCTHVHTGWCVSRGEPALKDVSINPDSETLG